MGIEEISIPTTEIEADGFITPPSALEHTEHANTACTGNATAQPMRECPYPNCELCYLYIGNYCTVPMVVSKQNYLLVGEKLAIMEKRLTDLENLITDEILGDK